MVQVSPDNSLNFNLWVVAKIYKQPQIQLCSFQVIMDLGTMFITQIFYCLNFDNYLTETYEIRFIRLAQASAFILQCQFLLTFKRYTLKLKFNLKAFLINRLKKAASLFLIYFENSSPDLITFFFKLKLIHIPSSQAVNY